MNLIFVTNMLNHHQYALCKAFGEYFDVFKLVATEKTQCILNSASCSYFCKYNPILNKGDVIKTTHFKMV